MTLLLTKSDIRNWIRNIEQHASDNVNKILVGNKADMDESKRVCYIFFAAIIVSIIFFLDYRFIVYYVFLLITYLVLNFSRLCPPPRAKHWQMSTGSSFLKR